MKCGPPLARMMAAIGRRADHGDMTDPYDLGAAVKRLARELEAGAASLEAAGDQWWPWRLSAERDSLADLKVMGLERILGAID